MRFIIDAQLPPGMKQCFIEAGHQAEHVADVGLRDADDTPIWEFALRHSAVIVTKDEDYAHRFHQSSRAPVILWLRIGNTSKRALILWFTPLLSAGVKRIREGDRLIEIR